MTVCPSCGSDLATGGVVCELCGCVPENFARPASSKLEALNAWLKQKEGPVPDRPSVPSSVVLLLLLTIGVPVALWIALPEEVWWAALIFGGFLTLVTAIAMIRHGMTIYPELATEPEDAVKGFVRAISLQQWELAQEFVAPLGGRHTIAEQWSGLGGSDTLSLRSMKIQEGRYEEVADRFVLAELRVQIASVSTAAAILGGILGGLIGGLIVGATSTKRIHSFRKLLVCRHGQWRFVNGLPDGRMDEDLRAAIAGEGP